MGIWKRKLENGSYHYQIRWKDQDGKIHSETFINRELARIKLAERNKEVKTNKALDIHPRSKVLFEVFCKEYLKWSKENKRSYIRDKVLVRNLLTHFKSKYLNQITPFLIEQYRMDRQKAVSKSTINREVACLRAIFNKAVLWDKFKGENPAQGTFYDEPERERYLTEAEMSKFYEALYHKDTPVQIRNICITALNTGMRKEEVLSLKWSQINWQEKKITVLFTKNGRMKTVYINQQLEDILRSIVDYSEEGCPYVFNHVWDSGKRDRYMDITFSWDKILEKAGIENFRFHDLRHTAGSYMYAKMQDLVAVQKVLGHRDIRSTERYVHAFDKQKKWAVSSLDLVYPRVKKIDVKEGKKEGTQSKNTLKLAVISKN